MAHLLTFFGGSALASASFSPSSITGLAVWLDANDLATITKDGGDLVSQWADKSGNNHHANQSTSSVKPIYSASGLNSRPTIYFDKSSNTGVMAITDAATLDCSAFSIFVVGMRKDDAGVATRMLWKYTSSPNLEFNLEWNNVGSDTIRLQLSSSGTAATGTLSTSNAPALNVPTIVDVQYDGTNATIEWNDANAATGAVGAKGSFASNLNIGHSFADEQMISEVLFYTAKVSDPERTQIMQYLAAKWGITL